MTHFTLAVLCPICEGELDHLNGTAHGTLSVAVVGCRPCGREWTVTVRLAPLESPETAAAARARKRRRRAVL